MAALWSVMVRGMEIEVPFGDLVKQADVVFLGRVVNVHSQWQNTPSGKAIVTDVEFTVERVYKGRPITQTTLRFLGGTVGDVSLSVEDAPTFRVGDRDVLFVSADAKAANPLVGGAQGCYRVTNDQQAESVRPSHNLTVKPITLQELEGRIYRAMKKSR
jgi:hypothetical protein